MTVMQRRTVSWPSSLAVAIGRTRASKPLNNGIISFGLGTW